MKELVIDGFKLNEEQIKILLSELKDEKVNTTDDLERYFKNHIYMKDNEKKCYLLVSKHPKKRNFAIPFDA